LSLKTLTRVSALAWNDYGIFSGSRDRFILQNDTRSNKQECKLAGHRQKVCGLKWSPDRQLLASGGNDNRLLVWNQSCINKTNTNLYRSYSSCECDCMESMSKRSFSKW